MNSKSVNRGQHTLQDTDSTEHIKHQGRVRNCFEPTQCFLSLLFCLSSLPAERGGLAHTRDGGWTPPDFCMCHLGVVQEWGCSRMWIVWGLQGCSSLRLGEKNPNGTIWIIPARSIHTARARGKRMQLWMVEVNRDKMTKNGAWMDTGFPKANMSTFTNSFMALLSAWTEGQRMRGSCRSICLLSKAPTAEQGRPWCKSGFKVKLWGFCPGSEAVPGAIHPLNLLHRLGSGSI